MKKQRPRVAHCTGMFAIRSPRLRGAKPPLAVGGYEA